MLLVVPFTVLGLTVGPQGQALAQTAPLSNSQINSTVRMPGGVPAVQVIDGEIVKRGATTVVRTGIRSSPYGRALSYGQLAWATKDVWLAPFQDDSGSDGDDAETGSQDSPAGAPAGGGTGLQMVNWPTAGGSQQFGYTWSGNSQTAGVALAGLVASGTCSFGGVLSHAGERGVGTVGGGNVGSDGGATMISRADMASSMCGRGSPAEAVVEVKARIGTVYNCAINCGSGAVQVWRGSGTAALPRTVQTRVTCVDGSGGTTVLTRTTSYGAGTTGAPVSPCPEGSSGTRLDYFCGLTTGGLQACGSVQVEPLPEACRAGPSTCVIAVQYNPNPTSTPNNWSTISPGHPMGTNLQANRAAAPASFRCLWLGAVVPWEDCSALFPDFGAPAPAAPTVVAPPRTGTTPTTAPTPAPSSSPTTPPNAVTTLQRVGDPVYSYSEDLGWHWQQPVKADVDVHMPHPAAAPAADGYWLSLYYGVPAAPMTYSQMYDVTTVRSINDLGSGLGWSGNLADPDRNLFPAGTGVLVIGSNDYYGPQHADATHTGTGPGPEARDAVRTVIHTIAPAVAGSSSTDPNPNPSAGPSTGPSSGPSAPPGPGTGSGSNPDPGDGSGSCLGGMWSWNPVDWVYVPIKCAFEIKPATRARVGSIGAGLSAVPPFSLLTAVPAWLGPLAAPGQSCPDWSVKVPAAGSSNAYSITCDDPFAQRIHDSRLLFGGAMALALLGPFAWRVWNASVPVLLLGGKS